MGVGKPSDIVGAVLRGIDMFDCVIPTRSGRNGQAFVENGTINLKNAQYQLDKIQLMKRVAAIVALIIQKDILATGSL